MVGHLRDEKNPQLLWQAAQALNADDGIYIDHIGKALNPALAQQAQRVAGQCSHYRWLGEQPHAHTRRSIQRAHVLVHPSHLEWWRTRHHGSRAEWHTRAGLARVG
jgi:hypothetical protein